MPDSVRPIAAAAVVSAALAGLDLAIVATAMPTVAVQLGGLELYAWAFTAYLVTSTLGIPIYGRAADRIGRKPAFVVATGVFTLGSAACGLAQSMPQLIAARLLQGAGGGGVYPITLTIVGDHFPTAARARLLGVLSVVWGVAALAGPAIGGFIAEQLNWRLAFFVQLPLAILAMALVAAFLDEPLLRRAARARPSLPRVVFVGSATCFAYGVPLFGQTVFVPQLLQGVLDATPTASGLVLSCTSLGWPVGANLCSRLVLARGYRLTGLLGALLILVGLVGLVSLSRMEVHSPLALAAATTGVCGLGFGFLSPALLLAMQNAVGWSDRGLVTGLNQFASSLGGTLGVAAAGALFSAALRGGAAIDAALAPAFAVLVGAAALAALLTILLPGGPAAPDSA